MFLIINFQVLFAEVEIEMHGRNTEKITKEPLSCILRFSRHNEMVKVREFKWIQLRMFLLIVICLDP